MRKIQTCFFRSVIALPGYKLEVDMCTGAHIDFDFTSRINTVRFGALKDTAVFSTAHTDGNYLLFQKEGEDRVKISPDEFMDLVLVDRTGEYPEYVKSKKQK
jgi:hypothetical protein